MRKLSTQNKRHQKVRAKQGMKDKIRKNLKVNLKNQEKNLMEASGKKQEILFEEFQKKQKKIKNFFENLRTTFGIEYNLGRNQPVEILDEQQVETELNQSSGTVAYTGSKGPIGFSGEVDVEPPAVWSQNEIKTI